MDLEVNITGLDALLTEKESGFFPPPLSPLSLALPLHPTSASVPFLPSTGCPKFGWRIFQPPFTHRAGLNPLLPYWFIAPLYAWGGTRWSEVAFWVLRESWVLAGFRNKLWI